MVTNDAQKRIQDVFNRITKSLSEEIQEINKNESMQSRSDAYELIEADFKKYSSLAYDLVLEVNNNLASGLREVELIKYINELDSCVYEIRDGYLYFESDEWIDRIYAHFGRMKLFGPRDVYPLTEGDRTLILRLAEEIRICCYEYAKAADVVASTIKKHLVAYMITPLPNPIHANKPILQTQVEEVVTETRLSKSNNVKGSLITESNMKLRWNGTNDSLYDLFAQLSLQNVDASTPLLGNTIEGIARFLSEHVENMPSYETIERRLRTFREPNGERPKRNRVEIDIHRDKA